MSSKESYCLWINQDTGEINIIEVTTPIEGVALGFYVPHWRGSKAMMERRKRKMIRERMWPKKLKSKRAV